MPDEATIPPAPSRARLQALDSDAWAGVLGATRQVLAQEPHASDTTLAAFRDAPTSRLVGGRLRAALVDRLVEDPALWSEVVAHVGDRVLTSDVSDARAGARDPAVRPMARPAGRGALEQAKQRARDAREERDVWRRRAEGADARAERLGQELERATAELEGLRGQLGRAEAALEAAEAERARAVERERRRRDGEIAAVQEQLATLRRDEELRRTEARRRQQAKRQAELDAQRAAAETGRRAHDDRPLRIVPGRPSRLPRGVAPGTTQEAGELLHRGRLLLVDGYNVTKQHQGNLDLETQRTWLIQRLGLLARQRGVRPTVVFDGQTSGGSRPTAGLRDVTVRFTDAGITADDEIVLAVEGTDEPVVVVTDDRELAERVAASGADVVGTRPFLGVAS